MGVYFGHAGEGSLSERMSRCARSNRRGLALCDSPRQSVTRTIGPCQQGGDTIRDGGDDSRPT